MKISDLKIGSKLISSFVLVILIFGAIAAYQILNFTRLKELEDESAQRASDTIKLHEIQVGVVNLYVIIADAIINLEYC